ncbi:MAG: hypothetical protein ACI8YQ_000882, partial [Polaribacter sp.]
NVRFRGIIIIIQKGREANGRILQRVLLKIIYLLNLNCLR